MISSMSFPLEGAALERAQRSRDIVSMTAKAKYGVKQAAPGNYRAHVLSNVLFEDGSSARRAYKANTR
jgi:hypothetical protein